MKSTPAFSGFSESKSHSVPVPSSFFTDLLPQIDNLAELKVTLYAMWFLSRQEGYTRYITEADFLSDVILCQSLGEGAEVLSHALNSAVERGTLLRAEVSGGESVEVIYFLNTPRGRATQKAFQEGKWSPNSEKHGFISIESERPNIFRLYEENIGPLTPMITEALKEAEAAFRAEWIEDAIRIAVQKNVRNWRYIDAILRSWQEKGRNETNRPDSEADRRKYIEGDYADFIQH
jgi:DNA replication protein